MSGASLYCHDCAAYLGSMGGDSCPYCNWRAEPTPVEDKTEQLDQAIAALKDAVTALKRVTASMAGAASAYRKFAKRHAAVGKADTDPFFTTRASDMDRAVDQAREALEALDPESTQ